jgi:general secretion pathway protein F
MARFRYKAVAPTGEVVEGEMEAPARMAAIERLRELRHLPVRVEEVPAGEPHGLRALPHERIEPVLDAPVAAPPPLAPSERGRVEPPPIERLTLDHAVEALEAEFAAVPAAGARTDPALGVHAPAPPDDPLVLEAEVAADAAASPLAPPEPDTAADAAMPPPADRAAADGDADSGPALRWEAGPAADAASPAEPPADAGWLEWQEAAAAIAADDRRGEDSPSRMAAEPASAGGAAPSLPAADAPVRTQALPESPAPEIAAASLAPVAPAAAPGKAARGRKALPARLLPVFTRELQVLLAAGLPVDRALRIIVEATANDHVAAAADALLARVRGGALLSEAMDAMPERFDEFLRTAVRAGEAGGALAQVLDQVASYQERGQRVLRSVRTALIYPAVLAFAAALSVVLLLTLVVPQFDLLLRQSAQVPPLATRLVIAASAFLRDWGWIAPAAALVLWLALRWRYADARRGVGLDRRALALPVIGPIVAGVAVERLARSLATLLGNGVSLPEALGLAANVVPNRAVGALAATAVERVKQGERLGDALEEGGVLPPLAVQLVRVGEESGRLVEMLARLADIYAGDVDVAVRRLTAVIEPALILLIGVVVGGIVLSLLAAIAGLNALAL